MGPHRLPVVRRGPDSGPLVVFAQPLFEELNRCRRLLADIGDALARLGIASALPDLPASGDHEDLSPWQLGRSRDALTAFAEAQPQICRILAVRGGIFLVEEKLTPRCFALSPVRTGRRVIGDLLRAHNLAERERLGGEAGGGDLQSLPAQDGAVRLAGYFLEAASAAALEAAEAPQVDRVRRFGRDEDDIQGPPVWRQADPQRALEAADRVAADIAHWMHR